MSFILLKLSLVSIFSINLLFAQEGLSASRLDRLTGEKVQSVDSKTKWDQRYNKRVYVYGKQPAKFLAENFSYLSPSSTVLDIGMGEGRNAVFLASKGHKVTGIDISSVAIKKALKLAQENRVKIKTILATATKYKFPANSFDAIICFYYVNRDIHDDIVKWLKPGGILIYEANTIREFNKNPNSKENKSYFLKEKELLKMFPNMRILKYEEPLHLGEFKASIILQKASI